MSERYTQIGNKGALLVMVLVISVWEMTVPMEATTGEYIKTESTSGVVLMLKSINHAHYSNFSSAPMGKQFLLYTCLIKCLSLMGS